MEPYSFRTPYANAAVYEAGYGTSALLMNNGLMKMKVKKSTPSIGLFKMQDKESEGVSGTWVQGCSRDKLYCI